MSSGKWYWEVTANSAGVWAGVMSSGGAASTTPVANGVTLVLVLSTMLHGIGVGNMLPSWVPMVCVDINPAVVTKLADRGSSQTLGIATDVSLFVHQLHRRLVAQG